MTYFKTLCGTTAIATSLFASSAMADVTAQQVWGDWKGYLTAFGYTIDATENMSGKTLTVSDINMGIDIPDTDADGTFKMGTLTFTEAGDGSVTVTMPEVMPMNFVMPVATGETLTMDMSIRQTGFTMVVTGQPDDMKYVYGAASLGMSFDKFDLAGSDKPAPVINAMSFDMQGVSGTTHAFLKDGLRSYDQTMKTANMVYDIDAEGPETEPGSVKMKGSIADLGAVALVSIPDGANGNFAADMAAAMEAGFAMKGGYTMGAGQTEFAFDGPDGAMAGATSSESGKLDIVMSAAEGLSYSGTSKGVKINTTLPQLPMPIDMTMAEGGFKLTMPVTAGEEPKPFGLGIRLIDFTIPDMAYAMIDPTGQLPRDPATIDIDVTGKARMFASLMDPKAMESGDAPGEVHEAQVNALTLKIAGAELTGGGAFTFDNEDKTTFPGMPAPEGALDLKLVGANALMDKLVAIGILPEQQAMSARMMMGLFAVAGEQPDTLTSKIEVNGEGHVLANGQRLK